MENTERLKSERGSSMSVFTEILVQGIGLNVIDFPHPCFSPFPSAASDMEIYTDLWAFTSCNLPALQ